MDIRQCYAKPIARNTFNINVTGVFHQTIMPRVKFVLNFRYNTFEKYMIDRWENPCVFFDGTGNAEVFTILYENFQNLVSLHACPYRRNETFTIVADRFEVDNYRTETLLPAGHYRLDIQIASSDDRIFVMLLEIFFEISDHRVWH